MAKKGKDKSCSCGTDGANAAGLQKRGDGSEASCGSGGTSGTGLQGHVMSPQGYMKAISHPLRKKILTVLFSLSAKGPMTKQQLAKALGTTYQQVHYQLNNHLREFWKVLRAEKVRGTYLEFITPAQPSAIFVTIGPAGDMFIIDPLAGVFGRLSEAGTRCDRCRSTPDQRKKCLEAALRQDCFRYGKGEMGRLEKVLERNSRKAPYTPVDYMLVCTVEKSMEGGNCQLQLGSCGCPFPAGK